MPSSFLRTETPQGSAKAATMGECVEMKVWLDNA